MSFGANLSVLMIIIFLTSFFGMNDAQDQGSCVSPDRSNGVCECEDQNVLRCFVQSNERGKDRCKNDKTFEDVLSLRFIVMEGQICEEMIEALRNTNYVKVTFYSIPCPDEMKNCK